MKGYYFITDPALSRAGIFEDVKDAIACGVKVIQYRNKDADSRTLYREALLLRKVCRKVILLINDRVDIALAVGAQGVHLGQDDLPYAAARRLLGRKKVIGITVHNLKSALLAQSQGADYLGVSPIFATPTKPDAGKPLGINLLKKIRQHVRIPIVAIGGITLKNANLVIAAGADALCAISAVVTQPDPKKEIRKFQDKFKSPLFIIAACLACLLFGTPNYAYSLDWRRLHEQADTLDSSAAKGLIKEKGSSQDLQYVLGLTFFNEHKDKEAGEVFSQLLQEDPLAPEYAWGRAEALRRGHDTGASQKILTRVIQEYPKFAPAYISLAYIKYREMSLDEAVKLASQVVEMGRQEVDRSNLVRAYLLIGGAKGMIAHYGGPLSKVINGTAVLPNLKKAQKLKPNSAEVLFGLGSYYFLAPPLAGQDLNRAIEYLEKAVSLDPGFADIYVRLGQAYNMKGDEDKYRHYSQKALEIDPRNELALDAQSQECKYICRSPSK